MPAVTPALLNQQVARLAPFKHESMRIIWGAAITLTGCRPVRTVYDPSHEPVSVPLRTYHEKRPSREAGITLFLVLQLETAGNSKLIQNGLLSLRTKRVRRIPLMSAR